MTSLQPVLKQKLALLQNNLRKAGRVCIAFSGGVDSTFLLKVAIDTLGDDCLAVIADGAMMPRSEFNESLALAGSLKAGLITVPVKIFELSGFYENSRLRCYYCKKHIFSAIRKTSINHGYTILLDGTNIDDLHDDRPGLKALEELSVISPLADAGLTKTEIRLLSAHYGLPTAYKPSMACMATRIPPGTAITPEALKTVETGEEALKALKLSQYRLRLSGSDAKIECGLEDFQKIINSRVNLVKTLKGLGITNIALNLKAYGESSPVNRTPEYCKTAERRNP